MTSTIYLRKAQNDAKQVEITALKDDDGDVTVVFAQKDHGYDSKGEWHYSTEESRVVLDSSQFLQLKEALENPTSLVEKEKAETNELV